jgi:ABC-type antimicrobial peptide transport system permease subunit
MFFGLLSALLVATGLFGTLAYRVSRRTSEIGIRLALGARRRQVLWMILRASLQIGLLGMLIGTPLAFACGRLLRSTLFGLGPADPVTFAGGVLGLTAVALVASWLPARRLPSVDPLVAVRSE